jgi:hypothetical protein
MPAAIPVVAGEAVLAAEVLAAEAAAAAAAEAASVAAAEAASIAAAEAAATAAAEQAATAAATEAATAATATGTSGLEALNLAQTQTLGPLSNQLPGQLTADQIAAYTNGIPTAGQGVQVAQAGTSGGIDALLQSQAAQAAPPPVAPPPAPSTMLDYGMTLPEGMARPEGMGGAGGVEQGFGTTGIKNPGLTPDQMAGPSDYSMSQGLNYGSPISAAPQTPVAEPGFFDKVFDYIGKNKLSSASMGLQALNAFGKKKGPPEKEKYSGPLSKFSFNPDVYEPYVPQPPTPYQPRTYNYAGGGPVEMMSNANAIGANTGYPMADINKGAYATPYQTPISRNMLTGTSDTGVNPMTGEMQFAGGGISSLGGYSDYARGGRMLKGPGDGMSDNIPATIAGKQPARLANEEFVVPADVVSHLGNGSSEAGAKALYKMMDRVRQARTGKKAQGKQINPEKYLA